MRTAIFLSVLGIGLGLIIYAGENLVYFQNYPKFLLIFATASLLITIGAIFTNNIPEDPETPNHK